MEIPAALSIDRLTAQQNAQAASSTNGLGQDAFLQLLVKQLQNQDPMTPLQDHDFIAQLAQFSSLEQLQNIDQGIQVSVLMNQAVNNSLATNLIGKEVLTQGNTVSLGSTDGAAVRLQLGGDAANVTVVLKDAQGNIVRTIAAGEHAKGNVTIPWDGNTDTGSRAEVGDYTVAVTANDAAGNPVAVDTKVQSLVQGVRFVGGTGYLLVDGSTIPLSDVVEVLSPTGE
ncbi:MAG: flagellar hook capping FlgD N-terminal domain-containing protein [bacterium]